jgi:16S rRNA (guanine527-N7)-methyltransferase
VLAEWRRAQELGFLGPGDVGSHLEHARAFRDAVRPPEYALDLGSGGGVPGLALALWWPDARWVLLDGGERRAVFLADAVEKLGLGNRVAVVHAAAESAGRDECYRATFDLVVARSFGPPSVVAECGAPLLREGGHLVVSEPPALDAARWPADKLDRFGLEVGNGPRSQHGAVVVLRQRRLAPPEIPRRAGIPARRPRW